MIVVDASLAAKWIMPEEYSEQAKDLYRATIRAGRPIVAAPLLTTEVTNILRQRMRDTPPLARGDALQLLAEFLTFPVELVAPAELHRHALILADDYGLPAVYDAHYVALAQVLRCVLWTDDRRLVRLLAGQLAFVRWIGDYVQPRAGAGQ